MEIDQRGVDLLGWEPINLFWKYKGLRVFDELSVDFALKKGQVEKLAKMKMYASVLEDKDGLTRELVAYVKERSGQEVGEKVSAPKYVHYFWRFKGLHYAHEFPELVEKQKEVFALAQDIIRKEYEEYIAKQTEKEKSILPEIINDFVDWARNFNKKSVTLKDVEYYLEQKDLTLMKSSTRALYLETNSKLGKG